MEEKQVYALIHKYKAGKLTAEETAMLESWYINLSANSNHEISDTDLSRNLGIIAKHLPLRYARTARLLWYKVASAAAVLLIAGAALYYYVDRPADVRLYTNDVAPGKNTATLTLAGGKMINLSDTKSGVVIAADKLAYSDGTLVSNQHPVPDLTTENVTVSTPRGGTYQVVLPDNTRAWLNADSKITFPSRFSGKYRNIELHGEAYFEVSKDKTHPFIVTTNTQKVQVLGTHFNINAYGDEPTVNTTLLEGSVMVLPLGEDINRNIVLNPGQEAVANVGEITIRNANIEEVMAWKEGYYRFNDADITMIMRQIARWYNVQVIYKGSIPKTALNGRMSRSRNISQVLKMLEKTQELQFEVQGKKVYVSAPE